MEYKTALAYAAGLAIAQRQNVLANRTFITPPVTSHPQLRRSPSFETMKAADTLLLSQTLPARTLRRMNSESGMHTAFVSMGMESNRPICTTACNDTDDMRGSYNSLDTISLPSSDWQGSSRRSSQENSQNCSETDSDNGELLNLRQTDPDEDTSTASSTIYHYESDGPQQIFLADISPKRFDELNMYVALSNGVRTAVASPDAHYDPASMLRHSKYDPKLKLPELFRSVCVCDPKIKGNPVYLRSKHFTIGPRGLRVARCEFLNLPHSLPPQQSEDSLALSYRPRAGGRPLFVLEYAMNLFSLESGLRTWVLAAQMDFTEVINVLTTRMIVQDRQEDLRSNSKCSAKHEEADGPSIDDFPNPPDSAIDWLSLVSPPPSPTDTTPSGIDIEPSSVQALQILLQRVRDLHRKSFMLSASLDEAFWQISWTSPALARRPDDVRVSFSHTGLETLRELEEALGDAEPKARKFQIRWGADGLRMWLWCIPMLRDRLEAWVCFLVDAEGDLMAEWCD